MLKTSQLPTPKLELSGLTDETGEVLRFAFRGETIEEVLKDYSLDELRSLMAQWVAKFENSGESWTIYTGPYIEAHEIRAILPECKFLEKVDGGLNGC
jgi:hypothetical protein